MVETLRLVMGRPPCVAQPGGIERRAEPLESSDSGGSIFGDTALAVVEATPLQFSPSPGSGPRRSPEPDQAKRGRLDDEPGLVGVLHPAEGCESLHNVLTLNRFPDENHSPKADQS